MVQLLLYLTIICYTKKDKIVCFVYGIILIYNLITFFCSFMSLELIYFECIKAYNINYVFITDSLYLDEYCIDYMSSGNNRYFDPVRDCINTDNPNNAPNSMEPSGFDNKTHTDMLADYLKDTRGSNLSRKGIRFSSYWHLPDEQKKMSVIAIKARLDNPELFLDDAGRTKVTNLFLSRLYAMKKNYDLSYESL